MFEIVRRHAAMLLLVVLIIPMIAACGGPPPPAPTSVPPADAPTEEAVADADTTPTEAEEEESTDDVTATETATEAAVEDDGEETTETATVEPTATDGAATESATGPFTPRKIAANLTGSGASFPDPIYQRWIADYAAVAPNVKINYQSVGSGQGVKDFLGGVTDFGVTDKYASDEEIAEFGEPFHHIPTVIGAVVATYNLEGIDHLQFSGETLADIFLGTINNWNDPRIAEDNPDTDLPDLPITVVHRSDSSGTTSIFTNYLASVSQEWADTVGAGGTVEWPTGIGGEKNPGVAAAVQQTPGAIGYVELIYALGNNMPAPAIKNAVGNYVDPTLESTSAAADGFLADMPDDLRVDIVDPPDGEDAYPIAGFTWILIREEMADEAEAQALTDFLYWTLTEGSATAEQIGYAPLPDSVREMAIKKLEMVTVDGTPVFEAPATTATTMDDDDAATDGDDTAAATAEPTAATTAATGPFTPRKIAANLTGSGASFPDPIYQRWIADYAAVAPNVKINYQSVGSGQGVKDFLGGVTDFGGTDKYASDEEIAEFGEPFHHIPTVIGAVVATYNLEGIDHLQFSAETLADIFLGTINNWNDPRIAEDNPDTDLPDLPITVVHRSDSSGTTSIFTNYLASVSQEWADNVGAGGTVEWPTGIGGEKNPGVAAAVQQTPGAIGYVELIYALGNNMPAPAIKNAVGNYVDPTLESTSAAADGFLADMPDDLRVDIVDPPDGEDAYPIAGFTWILIREEMADEAEAQALTDFLYWTLTEGSATAEQMGYAPLPDSVREMAIKKLELVTVNGTPVFKAP